MSTRPKKRKGPARDARGRFVSRRKRSKRKVKRITKPRAKGLLGLRSVAVPWDEMSPTFRKYVTPLRPFQRRQVYAFVEVRRLTSGSPLDFLEPGDTVVVPVIIGRYTRGQLADISRAEMAQILRDFLPGADIVSLRGFGHALLPSERRGMRFTRAKPAHRKARKTRNPRGNKPARKGPKKRRARRRV